MITPQESIKTTLASIFDRKGGAGVFTRHFEAFDSLEQNQLLQGVNMDHDELPVIAVMMANGQRVLITTKRILQFEDDVWSAVALSDIIDVEPIKFGAIKKLEMEQLVLKTKSGSDKRLTVEPGKPYFGVWNMLLNLVAKNRSSAV